MPNTKILEAIEQILIELRHRGETSAPLEESVRIKTGDLVISMKDLLAALTENTRRLEELKNDQGTFRVDMRREVEHLRRDLEKLALSFQRHEQRNQLSEPPAPRAVEVHELPPAALPPASDDTTDDAATR